MRSSAMLKDAEPRVRFFAAHGWRGVGDKKDVPAVLDMLRDNADKDPLSAARRRHGPGRQRGEGRLMAAADDPSSAVRMGVLLALRRTERSGSGPVPERSPIRSSWWRRRGRSTMCRSTAAMPKLAALVRTAGTVRRRCGYRVLNANFRLGGKENAEAVAAFAARPDASETLRIEALRELADWTKPSGRDRVMGLWRPLEPRPPERAADAFRPVLAGVFNGSDKVRQEAVETAVKLGIKEVGPVLAATAGD